MKVLRTVTGNVGIEKLGLILPMSICSQIWMGLTDPVMPLAIRMRWQA